MIDFRFFTDPVLRGPTLGSMLMCSSTALIGVLLYLRKQSLLGETLSHAAYPGVMTGVVLSSIFFLGAGDSEKILLFLFLGAFLSCYLAFYFLTLLTKKFKVSADASLCLILALFFGAGVVLASLLQTTQTSLYKLAQIYLYGQVATMTDLHIYVYGFLALVIFLTIFVFYRDFLLLSFDAAYAQSLGISTKWIERLFMVLVVTAVIVSMRSVGVVLLSSMFIAPAIAARQFSHKLSTMLIIAAGIGLLSGFLGVWGSVYLEELDMQSSLSKRLILPTGPMIVLMSSSFAIFSLLVAPKRGLLPRLWRRFLFSITCVEENMLKTIWKRNEAGISRDEMISFHPYSALFLNPLIWRLKAQGWIWQDVENKIKLTPEGVLRGANIVRLHRLWELYLVRGMHMGAERVHPSAEEMEHILTPDLEKELTEFLRDPHFDPHHKPIPPKEETL